MPWHASLIDSKIFSVHAALVPGGAEGKVVMFGGSEHNPAQGGSDETPAVPANVDRCAVYDVAGRAATKISSPTTDVFCAGHAFIADGRLLVGGGTEVWGGEEAGGPGGGHGHFHGNFGGHRACWIFNHARQTWDRVRDMKFDVGPGKGGGRWYPTIITLPNGDLAAFGGHPSRLSENWHENDIPERYSPGANTWTWYPHAFGFDHASLPGNWYPRANLVAGGDIFFTSRHNNKCRLFDITTGNLRPVQIDPPGGSYNSGWNYATIALPVLPGDGHRSRIMALNDTQPRFIDLDLPAGTPAWANAGTRQSPMNAKRREFSCPVYLPTGQILVTGGIDGTDDTDAVKEPELFTPNIDWATLQYDAGAIGTWQTINEPAQKARNYHSVALLLPDGSVFVAGSNIDGASGDPATVAQRNIEIYEPAYFGAAGRPQIATAPPHVTPHATSLSFTMASAAQAASLAKVALIRCGSVTHSGDFDHRYVALGFQTEGGSASVQATLPGDPSVTPPGYYMLWAVDQAGLPCQLAKFVRIGHVSCSVVADRSTFSQEEVQSHGASASFPHALYATFDGFLPAELPAAIGVELRWTDTNAVVLSSDVAVTPTGARWLEFPSTWTEVGQRITYPFTVEIRDPSIYDDFTDERSIRVTFSTGPHSCSVVIDLTKSPNPYSIDVDPAVQNPHWLSTDIRTFRIRAGAMMLGDLEQGAGAGAPEAFAKALIDKFRGLPNNSSHPFLGLPREGDAAAVDLAPTDGGARVYNYAVAKVRYRAVTTTAPQVKVFFRLCTTAATGLEYDTNRVYRNAATGAAAVPGLGKAGSEVASIPFFLSPRESTVTGQPGADSMAAQSLAANYEVQNIAPVTGQEAVAYFAAWLDINEPNVKRFPLQPGAGHGPWSDASAQSIQSFFRSPHHCLVAEIFFVPDPTKPNATPSTSDNLAQRNLMLLHADNPGAPGSRHVVHPFEIKPSRFALAGVPPVVAEAPTGVGPEAAAILSHQKFGPDELLVNWHNLPRDAEVTLFFSNVTTDQIETLATFVRRSRAPMERVDDRTLRLTVANHTWVPIPGGIDENIPVLLSVRLPDTVVAGDRYRISMHQVEGRTRQVIGSVDFAIPVSKAELLVERETRLLSIMRHIGTTIPSTNRWHPIFSRYLAFLAERVDGLGGDSGSVHPNPDGSGRPVGDTSGEPGPGGMAGDAIRACCRKLARSLWAIPAAAAVWGLAKLLTCTCGRRVACRCR